MRILVTGIKGFLAPQVAIGLQVAGHEVVGFDVASGAPMEAVVDAAKGCEVICHLGAVGDVYRCREFPHEAARANVEGCAWVAKAAKEHGCRVVYASTWEVYGARGGIVDETSPCSPDHPYNVTKYAGEQLLRSLCGLDGLHLTTLRLGSAYGPGMRPNQVIRRFIERGRLGETLTVAGDGMQCRQWTHTRDIAAAFARAARGDHAPVCFNIVAPEVITIGDLAKRIAYRFGVPVTFGPARQGDVPNAIVSADRAYGLLGWEAKIWFADGLEELIVEGK